MDIKNICEQMYDLIQKARKLEYEDYIDLMAENEAEGQFAVMQNNMVAVEDYDYADITHHVFVFSDESKAKEYFKRVAKLAELHEYLVHIPTEELWLLALVVDEHVEHIKCNFDDEVYMF